VASAAPDAEQSEDETGRIDGTLVAFEEAWSLYPSRNGKKLNKQAALTAYKRVAVSKRPEVLAAIGHYAASDVVARGFAEDMRKFLGHWQDWLEAEQSVPEVQVYANGHMNAAETKAYVLALKANRRQGPSPPAPAVVDDYEPDDLPF
jgi:hypothetical protein